MTQRIVLNLRDAVKGKEGKPKGDIFDEHGTYYGEREPVTLKRGEGQTPIQVAVYLDKNGKVVGAELRGYIISLQVVKDTSSSKIEAFRAAYNEGRTAIISALKLLVPGK